MLGYGHAYTLMDLFTVLWDVHPASVISLFSCGVMEKRLKNQQKENNF